MEGGGAPRLLAAPGRGSPQPRGWPVLTVALGGSGGALAGGGGRVGLRHDGHPPAKRLCSSAGGESR